MDWIEITIETTSEGADIAAQVLYDVGGHRCCYRRFRLNTPDTGR